MPVLRRLDPTLLFVCVVALAGCAGVAPRAESPTLAHVAHERDANGDAIVVVRDYIELMKVDGHDERHRVQYAWNYTRAIAQRRLFAVDGTLQSVEDRPGLTLKATDDEIAYATGLVRNDPRLKDAAGGATEFYGGFSVRDAGSECDVGSRCIRVLATRDQGRHNMFHAIVDLMRGRIVDASVDPGMRAIEDRSETTMKSESIKGE